MSDSHVEVKLDADIAGFIANMKRAERVMKSFNRQENKMLAGGGMNSYLSQMDKKNVSVKKSFDSLDQGVKMLGTGLTKFLGVALKGTILQMAAMGAAMLAIHASFVVGQGLAKLYAGAMKLISGGAAGLVVILGTVAAAMREQQAAMFSFSGGGAKQFGSGTNQARVAMRALATDADLAGLGMKNINKTYAAMAKSMNSTQILGSKNSIKALFDFGAAGQDPAAAAEKIGVVVEALNNSKKSFGDVQTAAKALGPQMEKAMKDLGIKSKKQFQEALLSGELAKSGGVFGQFAEVNNTLIGRVKTFFNLVKEEFADFGQKFLEPAKVAMQKVFRIIQTSIMKLTGELDSFGTGQFFDGLVSVVEKVSNFFVNVVRKYLPDAKTTVSGMSGNFERMAKGWQFIVDKLRPFIEGAKVLEQVFVPIFEVIKEQGAKSFGKFNEELVANSAAFADIGERFAGLIEAAFEVGRTFRAMIIDSLPFLSDVVAGLTTLLNQLNGVKQIFGNMFGSTGGLMAFSVMARQMKQTQGGIMGTVKGTMTLTPHTVVINAPGAPPTTLTATPGGAPNRYGGAGTAPAGTGTPPPGGLSSGKAPVFAPPIASQAQPAPTKQLIAGKSRSSSLRFSFGGRQQYQLPENQLYSQTTGRTLRGETRGMKLRALRGTAGGTALLGNKQLGISGAANGMGAKLGVGMGLSMLSQRAPKEMQGSLALGGMVGMYNPMAGLAIAGLGGAASARNPATGALAGGVGGAAAGAMVAGPVGAAIGGALGALGGALMGAANKFKMEAKEAKEAIDTSIERLNLEAIRDVGNRLYANIQAVKEGQLTGNSQSAMGGFNKQINRQSNTVLKAARAIQENYKLFTDEEIKAGTGAGSASDARTLMKLKDNPILAQKFKMRYKIGDENIGNKTIGEVENLVKTNAGHEYKTLLKDVEINNNTNKYGGYKISKNESKKIDKNATVAAENLIKLTADQFKASDLSEKQSKLRISNLQAMTGKTIAEIEALAYETGTPLYSATVKYKDIVEQLGLTTVKTAAQMRQSNTDILLTAGQIFKDIISQKEGVSITNEKAEAMRVQLANGTAESTDVIKFLDDMQAPLLSKFGGDPIKVVESMMTGLGTIAEPGKQFQKGGVFENIDPKLFFTPEVQKALPDFYKEALSGLTDGSASQIMTILADQNKTTDKNLLMDKIKNLPIDQQLAFFRGVQGTTTSLEDTANGPVRNIAVPGFGGISGGEGQDTSTAFLKMLGLPSMTTGTLFKDGTAIDNVVTNLDTYSAEVQALITANDEKFGKLFAGINARPDWMGPDALKKVFIEAGIIKNDTNTPRGQMVGDTTSSRLSQTMARHSSIDGMLTGKRSVTSAYRTTGLGSINSDHVTGRALDLVGPNLGQYKTLTDQAGGFAEFHGRGGSRHLHVVPGPGAMGDTTVPSLTQRPMAMTQSGGGGSTNYYTFQITGGNASPEEIANRVMAKIKDNARAEMER